MSWKLSKETLRQRRRELNEKNFPSEAWFERALNQHKISGYLRNYPIDGRFFGDFVWRKEKIVVEIDGSSHNGKEEYDKMRDNRMKNIGYKVYRIRFNDNGRMHKVIELLKHSLLVVKNAEMHDEQDRIIEQVSQWSSDKPHFTRKVESPKKKNKKLKKSKQQAASQVQRFVKLKWKIEGSISYAKALGGEAGNKFLAKKLNEYGLSPQEAKDIVSR